MKKIGLISDTHSFMDDRILHYLREVDEIWHAGDIGQYSVIEKLRSLDKPMKVVYGNIDDRKAQEEFPEDLRFDCEGVDVFITHIGGYPGRYNRRVFDIFCKNPPKLFICGHSHILKVMRDQKFGFMHMNPGACGHAGFHKMRTLLRFNVAEGKLSDLEAIELGIRGRGENIPEMTEADDESMH